MKDLIVSCIQADLHWENKAANLSMFETLLSQVPGHSHIIILPEMFSTGFTMNAAAMAETKTGPTIGWMKQQAARLKKIIAGSLIIEEEGAFYNRLIWMQPDGQHYHYDKKHLFGFAGEDAQYSAGRQKVIVQVNGWRINLQVCYDLRFPVWARQAPPQEGEPASYDILLYVANWPQRRINAWDTLLKARAIENQSYVIGVNRVGNDAHDIYHNGSSSIIDPWGEVLWNLQEETGVYTHTFQYQKLEEARSKLPFLKDADRFIIL